MKRFIKHYAVDTFALWSISQIATGIIFEDYLKSLLMAGVALMITTIIAKPVINLLLLPLNLVTFGLFRWISSAIALYIVTLVIPGFKIIGFYFNGLSTVWFDIPKIDLSGALAYVAFSFLLSIITSLIYWITD